MAARICNAAGQAASTLHATDIHEGGPHPALMQKLCSGTDFTLWALKVTAQAFSWAMSTLVVQERYLWLNLAEMRDAEKGCLHTEMVQKWCTRK